MSAVATQGSFDAGALGAKYTALAALPSSLYEAVVTHSTGDLLPRVGAVLEWRRALLEGAVPDPLPVAWPGGELGRVFTDLLGSLQLPRFAKGEEEVVDAVLLDMLRLASQAEDWRAQVMKDVFEQLVGAERARRERETREERYRRKGGRSPLEELNVAAARLSAERTAKEKTRELIEQAFRGAWGARSTAWLAVEEMFGPLSNLLGLGWDLTRSVLRSTGWLAAEKLRALLQRLPELKKVIEALGRMAMPPNPSAKSLLEDIIGPLVRPVEMHKPVLSPDVPIEMRGVERSGDIARMLPSEAAMLTHPLLKRVWHARRSERSLLTYEAQGIDFHTVLVEREEMGPGKKPRAAEEKGPILLCLDTSGSMTGAPETVAKAIALEALRTAHAEKRRLFAYLFSGPGDVVERELSLSKQGLSDFLDFLASSFHGGTDVAGPLNRALDRLEDEDDWRNADVLLVSDGEFPVDVGLAERVEAVREIQNVRVHGLLVGSDGSTAMERLCDPLHRFSAWRALLGDNTA